MTFDGNSQFRVFETYGWACLRGSGRNMDKKFSSVLVFCQYVLKQSKYPFSTYMKDPATPKLSPVSNV